MQIFEKACQARGQLVVTEAALMMLNSLEGDNWLAMEDVSLDRFDSMKAFDEFYTVFDRDCQYDPEQELPARMEELVTGFHRQRAEPLSLYVRRLDALVVKLRELKIEWSEPFLSDTLSSSSSLLKSVITSGCASTFSWQLLRGLLHQHMFLLVSCPWHQLHRLGCRRKFINKCRQDFGINHHDLSRTFGNSSIQSLLRRQLCKCLLLVQLPEQLLPTWEP